MKVQSIEATNMGNDQQQIADEVLRIVADQEFSSEDEFFNTEGALITLACRNLGWHSVPQSGGLLVEWQ